ncbi:hypothetical protein [Rhodopseudomonas sp. B29]|uniref:hypothetical protein n=1 Tax=Rhodopseudomonas sp. B29 TaxID=95607 RepID=UPI0011D1CCA5|nr:hypothetical protein [Rhodopseudomonas sp. B29]
MTEVNNHLLAQITRQNVALLWLICGLGNTIYAVIQILTLVNHQIDGAGPSTPFDATALWYFGVACSIWVVPILVPLITTSRVVNWAVALLGSLLVALSVLGGVFDGMRDGLHIAATAAIAVALPGFYAIRSSWRLLRATDGSVKLLGGSIRAG